MRKNRFGYRKKALLSMRDKGDAYRIRLECEEDRVSAAMARWIYKHAFRWHEADVVEIEALQHLRFCEEDWVFDYLWDELRRRKAKDIGDWILIALASQTSRRPESEIQELIDLYHDDSASLATRGSALFVISGRLQQLQPSESTGELIRELCAESLYDAENGYARAGATWIARNFDEFKDRIEELKQDQSQTQGGGTVSFYVQMVD